MNLLMNFLNILMKKVRKVKLDNSLMVVKEVEEHYQACKNIPKEKRENIPVYA